MSLWKKVGMSSAINTGYFLGLFSLQYYQEKRREYNYYDHTVFITQFISRLLCGQQQDLMAGNMDKTIENYYSIARGKTGSLINMACLLGSMSYSYIAERVQVIAEFADSLAIYYQIIDDLKDISDGISLDSSNIYFFVRNKQQSEELVLHEIERIIDKQMNNVTEALRKLHISGILKTYKVDDFINGLLLG